MCMQIRSKGLVIPSSGLNKLPPDDTERVNNSIKSQFTYVIFCLFIVIYVGRGYEWLAGRQLVSDLIICIEIDSNMSSCVTFGN